MIIVDTNVFVALADRDDRHHARCRDWFSTATERLLILPTVLAETFYLIDRELGPQTEAAFLNDLDITPEFPYQLVDLLEVDLRRMAELLRVATLNRRDFDNVRPVHATAFSIVP